MDEIKPFTDRIKRLQEANDTLCEQLADQNVLRFHIKELEKQLAESKAAGRQATEHLLLADRGRREAEAAGAVLKDRLDLAWGLIANAGGGDWSRETPEWAVQAGIWRDENALLPASVRRHVAVDTALEEVEQMARPFAALPSGNHESARSKRLAAALAKLDAARRWEG